jgi:hypothetical protein
MRVEKGDLVNLRSGGPTMTERLGRRHKRQFGPSGSTKGENLTPPLMWKYWKSPNQRQLPFDFNV